ncbi:MAG: hypothetical protein PVH41_00925 [Anaerolineae bacterium]|jgi:hypothetical protein
MKQPESYEQYPTSTIVICNLVAWSIYAIGAYLLGSLWTWLLVPYLLYGLGLEVRLLRVACVDCTYYGKACAFGKGRLCAAAFAQGDPQRFASREISWVDVLPDFLVSIVPLIGGIVLLALRGWNWIVAGLLCLLLVLAFFGTGFVRGSLACRHCKQREIGCAALDLFEGRRDG